MDLAKIEAGRELDALVAEKVMGWHVERFKFEYDGHISDSMVWITDPKRKDDPPYERQDVTINPKPYSTDMSAAWEVVEKLIEKWESVSIRSNEKGSWEFYFSTWGFQKPNPFRFESAWLSAPHSICLAALTALSEGQENGK
jgi:hypothetical protein